MEECPPRSRPVSRRSVLAGAAGAVVAASGCIDRAGSAVGGSDRRLSLAITTVPDDDDRQSVEVARELESALEAVGVGVSIDLRTTRELRRTVLVDHDFDCFVSRHPLARDPDALYGLLHSRFVDEVGWQNPFGYTSLTLDEQLEAQRATEGERRRRAVADLLRTVAAEKPFVPLCVPDDRRVARADRFDDADAFDLSARRGFLALDPGEDVDELAGIVTDARLTRNLNPLAITNRDRGPIVDLLYDPLLTASDDGYVPWLAESVVREGRSFRVTLREGCRFHDDEPVTAADVAFTYDILADASLGEADAPVPQGRYRGEVASVEGVEVRDDRTCAIAVSADGTAALRALTVPILPEHVWREVAEGVVDDPLPRHGGPWRPLRAADVPPIGGGPYAVAEREEGRRLVLERHDGHFTRREDVELPSAAVERLALRVYPGSASAVHAVDARRADLTVSPLEAHVVDDAAEREDATLVDSSPESVYVVGFNARTAPLSNPYFRRLVASLLDPAWLAEEVFDGHAEPTAAPVAGEWVPDDLAWDGADPVSPFIGEDGELDADRAREAFRRDGFRYDEDDRLVVPG